MIELPFWAKLASFTGTLADAGFTQRGLQSLDRIDRKGSRHRVTVQTPIYRGREGALLVSRLIRAKQEGIRIALPLAAPQGSPGAVVLAADVSTGRTIAVEGGTPGYACKEGFWLSLVNADGRHFAHSVSETVMFDAAGAAELTLDVMVRDDLLAGSAVHLARPKIEGLLEGDEWEWSMSIQREIPIEFTIEEAR